MANYLTNPQEVRPESFDLSKLFQGFTTSQGDEVASVNPAKMGRFLQMIMNIESYGGKNMRQDTGGPGSGLFQLETGENEGGWTRLNRAFLNLPARLTPQKLARHRDAFGYRTAEGLKGSFDATRFDEQEQIYLMAANIMLSEGGRELFDKWAGSGSDDDFLDWWAKYHWAGSEDESEIKTKKEEVKKNL